MTTEKLQPQQVLEKALRDLGGPNPSRSTALDARRSSFVRLFKLMDAAARSQVSEKAVEILKERFAQNASPDDILFILGSGIAGERDWETVAVFLSCLLAKITNSESLREIAISLLEIADNELSTDKSKLPLGQTALVLLTEMGLQLANHGGASSLDHRGTARVVEYITTSLLARSNVNDNAMRIALIHYLAKSPLNSQSTLQLNRVISRFGQSLLDDLMKAFFEDKKRNNAAFHFLVQHLNVFFVSSPALAEMSHDVLKHYMLKYPEDFPSFISGYCEAIPREELRLRLTTRHVALLLRNAIDVAKRPLAEALCEVLVKHVAIFRDASQELLDEQVRVVRQIVGAPGRQTTASAVVEQLFAETQILLDEGSGNSKIVSLAKARKTKKAAPRAFKFGAKPSPLETMLALAS